MKARLWKCILAVAVFAALAVAVRMEAREGGPSTNTRYRVFALGETGGTAGVGNTINDLGWAMGGDNLPGDVYEVATVWIFGQPFTLGTLGGPNSNINWPNRNTHGQIVGTSETASPNLLNEVFSCPALFNNVSGNSCDGFVYEDGAMHELPTLGGYSSVGAGVNNLGQAVGWAENTVMDPTCDNSSGQFLQFEAVQWDLGTDHHHILPPPVRELPPLPPDLDSAATAINDLGQAVGISGKCSVAIGGYSAIHAVLWEDGHPINLGSLGGHGWNTPIAINNHGVVVGFANSLPDIDSSGNLELTFHAFVWTKATGMVDLKTLPGDAISEATGVNEAGQIVGVSYGAGFSHPRAFIYENGKMTPLDSLSLPGTALQLAITGDINDRGEITGEAIDTVNGGAPAFLAVPVGGEDQDGAPGPDAQGSNFQDVATPQVLRDRILRRFRLNRPGNGQAGSQ
ncbi:MAG TPA: hypothetical protein VJW51_14490 [Candidatus Acidoferrales bacterium]|nr:hypothetical protein [Candidatus Acidoferrales bacterium]